jgi:hypothetical protein
MLEATAGPSAEEVCPCEVDDGTKKVTEPRDVLNGKSVRKHTTTRSNIMAHHGNLDALASRASPTPQANHRNNRESIVENQWESKLHNNDAINTLAVEGIKWMAASGCRTSKHTKWLEAAGEERSYPP